MPSRNSLKIYSENSYYHIFNRGVDKRNIFEDDGDYLVFLKYLRDSLSPIDEDQLFQQLKGLSFKTLKPLPENYSDEIDLLAYCLMPNHLHFEIKQKYKNSICGFMHSLMTRYSMYFNKKYDRVGPLFQGRYKAELITNDEYLLHLSRYIHLNPLGLTNDLLKSYSSYADYLKLRKSEWVKTGEILKFFGGNKQTVNGKINSYKKFVEISKVDSLSILGEAALE